MPVTRCYITGCEFVTPDDDSAITAVMLSHHLSVEHAPNRTQVNTVAHDKVKKPVLLTTGTVVEEEQWSFFLQRWRDYKALCNLTGDDVNRHLRDCLPNEVGLLLHSTYGPDVERQTENELLENIKRLSVRTRNKLATVVEMTQLQQGPDQPVETFLAKLKTLARHSDLKTQCSCTPPTEVDFSDIIIRNHLVAGVYDGEIQNELLKKDNLPLEEAVKIVSDCESAKRSQEAMKGGTESASKVSSYKKNKNREQRSAEEDELLPKCHGCGSTEHGESIRTRKEKCKAWGKRQCPCGRPNHIVSVCKSNGIPPVAVAAEVEDAEGVFLFQVESENKKKKSAEVNALEYDEDTGKWVIKASKNEPLPVRIEVDKESLKKLGSPSTADLETRGNIVHLEEAVPDTGATVTCGGAYLLRKLGIPLDSLLPSRTILKAANKQKLTVLGTIPLKLCIMKDGKQCGRTLRELLYITEEMPKMLLSRDALKKLGSIPASFPFPPETLEFDLDEIDESLFAPCGCLRRTDTPPPPDIPFEPSEENVPKLKEFLIQYYASSTFNTCAHQPLPLMHGPPLEFCLKKDAVPARVRIPATVAIHWRKKVKNMIDQDVELGVLEWVPENVPETWCHRMVVTRRHNGDPRRTVDMQTLNDASLRQTHHTKPPFQQAMGIPHNTYKSVTDAWNGYHSVAIAEKDRHLTTFITEWGRLRYKTAPQGYLASGDAYTFRFDKVTRDVKNVHRNVDDSLLHEWSIKDIFASTAAYLTLLGENGILQNPDKFQFGSKTVDWSGFRITADSVKPLPEHTESILNFPAPKNATDLRSFFALCNQIANFYAVSPKLHPLRELLKKGTRWYWDAILENLFSEMKTVIAKEVEKGVTLFDPKRKTAIMSDWCKSGIGYVLAQKHCQCEKVSLKCCTQGWKVCLVGSRFTNKAERNYSPTEGELLGIQDSLKRSKYFTLGCDDLIVGTDHKPLLGILNNKCLENIDNPRLVRLKEKTLAWRFSLQYIPGKENGGPDCLSRYGLGNDCQADFLESEMSDKELRQHLYVLLPDSTELGKEVDIDDEEYVLASTHLDTHPITWKEIEEESSKDEDIVNTIKMMRLGSESVQQPTKETLSLFKLNRYLREEKNALIYKGRAVIPKTLRKKVLDILHAAHQGVTKMTLRAEESVFWPNISIDIKLARLRCISCDKIAPSQWNLPPADPVIPEYPFQHICADHMELSGHCYGIIVDRFSNWFHVYHGKGGSNIFLKALRTLIENFNIPETITTDGGSQYIAEESKQFYRQYGIHHRLCSVGNPHANSRAEIGVKSAKRLLRDNTGFDGKLDTVKMSRALIVHRNTPNESTGLSPAEMLLGRKLRGFLPNRKSGSVLKSEDLADRWKEIANWRELALAKRSSRDQEKWTRGTRNLPSLPLGTHVMVQNQLGNCPRRWDKRGVIVSVLPHDQYEIMMDGSRRLTLRNRKFIRAFIPIHQGLSKSRPMFTTAPLSPTGRAESTPTTALQKEVLPSSQSDPSEITTPPSPNQLRETLPAPGPPEDAQRPHDSPLNRNSPLPSESQPVSPIPLDSPFVRQRLFSDVAKMKPTSKLELKKLETFNKPGRKEGPIILPRLRPRTNNPTGSSS